MSSNPAVIPAVIEQHADEAAFLWLLRDYAVRAPHYTLSDLAQLDNRVDAHIDGLRIAADGGWEISKNSLSESDTGEFLLLGYWRLRVVITITFKLFSIPARYRFNCFEASSPPWVGFLMRRLKSTS